MAACRGEPRADPAGLRRRGGRQPTDRRQRRARPPLSTSPPSTGPFHRLWSSPTAADLQSIGGLLRSAPGPDRRRPPPLRDLPAATRGDIERASRPDPAGLRSRAADRPVTVSADRERDPPQRLRARADSGWRARRLRAAREEPVAPGAAVTRAARRRDRPHRRGVARGCCGGSARGRWRPPTPSCCTRSCCRPGA